MADGTVRGAFELSADAALRDLTSIRDRGREADAALDSLGRRMDSISRKVMSPRIELVGFDRVNAQLAEIEARLDRLSRRSVSSRVGVSGGFSGGGGGFGGLMTGNAAGGANRDRVLSTPGGFPGALPWWAAAIPFAPGLIGGATGLLGSAGSAALGAGAVGLGGLSSLGAGVGLTAAVAQPAIQALGQITAAQKAYNQAIEEYGRKSSQAATAARALNAQIAANPGAAGTVRQLNAFTGGFRTATASARANVYRGASSVLYNARRATPTLAAGATAATGATAGGAGALSGFLAQPAEQGMLLQLTGSFAQNLPVAERSLENIVTIFGHLSVDALPFFREANIWVENWTTGAAARSANTTAVSHDMSVMAQSAKDWARLLGAGERTLQDIFTAGRPSGDSMVVQLTDSIDSWDRWINNNPTKVKQFFTDAENSVDRIATVISNLVGDVFKLMSYLNPIFSRAESFLSLASGLGGGSALSGAAILYGGYEGARGALGGRGPSAGGALRSFIGGGSPVILGGGRGLGRAGGGAVVGGGGAPSAFTRSSYLMPPAGFQAGGLSSGELALVAGGGVLMRGGATRDILGAARGEQAFNAAYGPGGTTPVEGAHYAPLEAGAAVPMSELSGLAGRLGQIGSAAAGAAKGAARFLLPLAAIQAVVGGTTGGGPVTSHINRGLSTGLSTLTLGTVPTSTFQHIFSGAFGAQNAGPSAAGAFAQLQPLATQAGNVRTAGDLHSLLGKVSGMAEIGVELAPGDQAKLTAAIRQITSTAAANAGAGASNTWETAFTTGLEHGTAPSKAVSTMLGGIGTQVKALGPSGARAFASDTAQWASQLSANNPKLQGPLNRLMAGIVTDINRMNHDTGTSFADLQRKVFFINGQILTGTSTAWGAIRDALVNPMNVAQEKLEGIFGQIQAQAVNALTGMGFSKQQAQSIVSSTARGGAAAANANVVVAAAGPTGVNASPLSPTAPPGLKRARGGMIGGSGLLDTVPTPDGGMAAPGEAYIANRHTMQALTSATLSKYGKTAWQMINDEGRPHSAPMRYAVGGNVTGAGMVGGGFVPEPGTNFSYGQEPQIASALNTLARMLHGTIYGISGYRSAAHSVAVGGFADDPHTRGQAADIGYNSLMRASAAQITAAQLASVGLWRPFDPSGAANNPEVNHVQLLSGGAQGAQFGGTPTVASSLTGVSLKSPQFGPGIAGALATGAGRAYATGLQARLNATLGAAGGGATSISSAGFSGGGTPTANQQLGRQMMLAAGWGADQWPYLQALWTQESGWNANAVNPSSGASGIPQALGHGNVFPLGQAGPQIAWGLNYIRSRYGSPEAAEAHERSYNWYQRGGAVNWAGWNAKGGTFMTNGPTLFGAGEKGRETVSISRGGAAGGITIKMENVTFYGGDQRQLEQVAEMVATKINDALDKTSSGSSDRELIGAKS